MSKKILVALAATVAMALAIPAMASASTTVPPLGSNTQAFIANPAGTHVAGSATLTGTLNLVGGATITCTSNAFGISWNAGGTGSVTSFTTSGCSVTGFPTCVVTVTPVAGQLPWGVRLVKDTGGVFRALVNVGTAAVVMPPTPATGGFNVTFVSGACPAPAGVYTDYGTLTPSLSFPSAGVLRATFGTGSGSVVGPLGSATVSGFVQGAVLTGGGTQLVI